MANERLSKYNPVVIAIVLLSIICLGMINSKIINLLIYVVSGTLFYIILRGRLWLRLFVMFIPMCMLITGINMWISGSEGLYYGGKLSAMIYGTICWFGCFAVLMDDDKIYYILGGKFPTIALIFSIILSGVPRLMRKAAEIADARRSFIKGNMENGSARQKINEAAEYMGILTGISLENSIVTSDSMKCRGYGCGKRSTFSIFKMRKTDICILILTGILITINILCALSDVQYVEEITGSCIMLIPIVLCIIERKG